MDQPTAMPEASAAPNSEADQLTSSATATRNKVFFGPNGLRAGWRVFLYLVLVVVAGFAIRATVRPVFHALNISRATAGDTPWFDALQRFMIFLSFLVPALVLSRLEKRPMRVYGLGMRAAFGKYFWEGALWGFAALSLLLVAMRISNVFWFGQAHFDGRETIYYAVMWGIDFLVVGLMEEFMFRGYVQYALTSGMGFLGATTITSLLFFAAHTGNQGESAMGLLDVFLGGIVLSVMLWRTGSLWFAVGFHAAWDWAQSFFYGVPDSGLVTKGHLFEGQSHGWALLGGGSVGPEGSLYSSLIEIVLVGLVLWRFKKPLYPDVQSLPRQLGSLI